jgi:hypothetical protein
MFLSLSLQDVDPEIPMDTINSLVKEHDRAIMDVSHTLCYVVCSATRWLHQRLKPSWGARMQDLNQMSN